MKTTIYEWLIMSGALAGVLVAFSDATQKVRKFWSWGMRKLFSHRYEIKEAIEAMNARDEVFRAEMRKTMNDLAHEMKPNSGTSLRDAINRIESRMIVSDQRQRAVMMDSGVGVFETNASGHFIWVNRKFCRIVGRTAEEMLGSGWLNAVVPEQREAVHDAWEQSVNEAREFHLNFSVMTPEGVVVPILVRSIRMIDRDHKLAGYMGFISAASTGVTKLDPAGM